MVDDVIGLGSLFTIYIDKATETEWALHFPTASSKMQTHVHKRLLRK